MGLGAPLVQAHDKARASWQLMLCKVAPAVVSQRKSTALLQIASATRQTIRNWSQFAQWTFGL